MLSCAPDRDLIGADSCHSPLILILNILVVAQSCCQRLAVRLRAHVCSGAELVLSELKAESPDPNRCLLSFMERLIASFSYERTDLFRRIVALISWFRQGRR